MSELLDSIIENTTLNGQYTFIDGDTIRDKAGEKYRIQGMDAPEISKLYGSEFLGSTAGGIEATRSIQKLAREQGFTNVVKTGKVDPFGRPLVDLQDDKGNSFTTKIISSGALESNMYTQAEDINSARIHELFDDQIKNSSGEFKKGADQIRAAIESETRKDLLLRDKAVNELDYLRGGGGGLSGVVNSSVLFKKNDRDLNNDALNPLGESFETGLYSVKESLFGIASWLGYVSDVEMLEEFGEDGAARVRGRIAEQDNVILDYKDVKGFGDAIEFVGNNLMMSLPYMGMTVAGTLINPVVGLSAMSSVYTGQTWNEMEGANKDAALALGSGILQATVDRFSLQAIVRGTGKLTLKESYNDIVADYAKKYNVSSDEAKKVINSFTRKELANVASDGAKLAKDQLGKRKLAIDFLNRVRAGAATEGTTEALQESIGYVSAHTVDGFDFGELQERAVSAFVAGGSLGGGFGAVGSAANAGAWMDIAYGKSVEDPNDVAKSTMYAREEEQLAYERAKKKYQPLFDNGSITEEELEQMARNEAVVHTTDEIVEHYRENVTDIQFEDQGLNASAERGEANLKNRTAGEKVKDFATGGMALLKGQVHQTFTDGIRSRSRTARMMRDVFGGGVMGRVFGGADFENFKHHMLTFYKGFLNDDPENIYRKLNNGKNASQADKERISNEIYGYVDKNGNLDLSSITDPTRKANITALVKSLENLADRMHSDQVFYNPELGKLKNYLLQYKTLNKKLVYKNRKKFASLLAKNFDDISYDDAIELTDRIIDNDIDLDEAFSVVKGGPQPTSHKKRTLGLSKIDDFNDFFEKDLFVNASFAAKSAARYVANQKYVGKNGEIIAKMLRQMRKEGLTQEEVDHIAFRMKNYLDSESGNYKRPTTPMGKTFQNIQKNFMFITMVAGLPLSTLSSFVEVALGSRGLTNEQIFGKPGKEGGLSKIGKEFAATMQAGMTEITNAAGLTNKDREYGSDGRKILSKVGFYEWDVGAATTTGVLETHTFHQKFVENYFKWIGLQGWTNFNRATRAAIAGDFIRDNLEILANRDVDPNKRTNSEREAEEKLRNLGLDVSDVFVEKIIKWMQFDMGQDIPQSNLTNAERGRIDAMIREAEYSFVNEAVALPKAANRPLFYLDPRFALLNQFQGFMSTFTANHIPRLWNEYIKRGSTAMKYNTFAMMTAMIMLGFASQYLKDLIKYGEVSPYLDEAELVRRGVLSSGLAGTPERVIEFMFPIYETRSKNAGEWVWNTASGESPSLANVARLGQGAAHLIKGEIPEATWDVSKATIGPLANVIDNIYRNANPWNY